VFNEIEILQGRWQHGEKVGYCYPSGLEKTLCEWDIYVPLVTRGLIGTLHSSIAHSIICTLQFHGKMHSDWFNGIEILQGRWQNGEQVGYCYPSRLEKTLCKWDIYVTLVTKGLIGTTGYLGIQMRCCIN
jgi:hypothetical protein